MKFGVISVEGREAYLENTLRSLDAAGITERDSSGNLQRFVFVDRDRNRFENHRRGWRELFRISNGEYVTLFEDDIEVAGNLGQAIDLLLRYFRPPLLSMYSGRNYILDNLHQGYVWVGGSTWLSEPALTMKRDFFADFDSNFEQRTFTKQYPYFDKPTNTFSFDYTLQRFLHHRGLDVLVTAPSLVQHVGYVSSIKGHNWKIGSRVKQSHAFLGADKDAFQHYRRLLNLEEV